MNEKEAIDILENIISDEVIGTYCIEIQKEGVNCSENCKDEDCYLIQAIDTILDLYKKEKEKNKELEDADLTTVYINGFYDGEKKWKDKIREKIQELEKEADYKSIDNPTGRIHFHKEPCDYQIQVLQELLEERN